MKQYFKSFSIYILIFMVLFLVVMLANNSALNRDVTEYTHTSFQSDLENDRISKIDIYPQEQYEKIGKIKVTLKDETEHQLEETDINELKDKVLTNYKTVELKIHQMKKTSIFVQMIPSLLIMVVLIIVFMFIMQQAQGSGGGNKVMSFGKSKAKMVVDDKNKVLFKDVAGLIEEKAELSEVVDFLKQPKKFVELGARIPKGVLLVGPPGTGKTLLAKAVAGEGGVPFFSISGSDFVEMFVGVGASRVRDLFDQAKKNAPCIIFIDEIDAVGRKRGAGLGGGHDEREQTLNQLLVEMDGFGVNEGVIVISATNRVDILDPALLRPGRFDRRVLVGRPDVRGREEILIVHAKGKPLNEDVDLKVVAKTTAGFTGADLENLLNESSILAARADKKYISMKEIQEAFIKVGIGTEKKSRVISEKEKKITAYHEAGHAIIHQVLKNIDSVHSISIIPTGMAGGYTMPLPGEDKMYMTKSTMEEKIVSLLGGRAAEKIIFNDVTTGASNDIERATRIARNMVTKYGMSELLGPIQFGDDNDEVFIGKDLAHTRNYGEGVAAKIDSEIRRLVETGYEHAIRLLEENIDILHKTSKTLIEKEKINGEEFAELFKGTPYEKVKLEKEPI